MLITFLNFLRKMLCRTCLTHCQVGSPGPVFISSSYTTKHYCTLRKNSDTRFYFSAFLPSPMVVASLCSGAMQALGPSPGSFWLLLWMLKNVPRKQVGFCACSPPMGCCSYFFPPSPSLSPENLEETRGKELDPFMSRVPRDLAFKNSIKFQLFSSTCLFLLCSAKGEIMCAPASPQTGLSPFGIQFVWLPCDFRVFFFSFKKKITALLRYNSHKYNSLF